MSSNCPYEKIERGPDYSRVEASFIVEEIARKDYIRKPSLSEKLNWVAARIEQDAYDLSDIRLLELFRRSSTALKNDDLFYKLLKDVIWQMRNHLWIDENGGFS